MRMDGSFDDQQCFPGFCVNRLVSLLRDASAELQIPGLGCSEGGRRSHEHLEPGPRLACLYRGTDDGPLLHQKGDVTLPVFHPIQNEGGFREGHRMWLPVDRHGGGLLRALEGGGTADDDPPSISLAIFWRGR